MSNDNQNDEIYDFQVQLTVPKKPIGKREISEVRDLAARALEERDLCLCSIDERHYVTKREVKTDRKQAETCSKCGNLKLRINYIDAAPKRDRIVLVTSWKTKPSSANPE